MLNQFSRTQLLLGKEGMDRLFCFCAADSSSYFIRHKPTAP